MEKNPSREMKNIRCAVIGIGNMGSKYAVMLDRGEIEGLSLAAVCCRSDERAAWARANLSADVQICRSEDALYEAADTFDAVIIVTPHKQHPAMAIRAFAAGKHVMCDKPAGTTAADALSMNEAAARSGRVYAMMCHQRAYDKHVKIRDLLREGAIGRICRVSLENSRFFRTRFYHASGSWRSSWTGEGGGALINQGYHLLDFWLYLFGLPQSVYADIPFGKYNDFSVDDEATLVLDYPDKMTGTFILTTGEGVWAERMEIIGTGGRILLEDDRLTLTRFDQDLRDYARTAQVTARQELGETTEVFDFGSYDRAYHIMLQNFSDAIRSGAPLIAPGEDSANALSLINAAYLSAWEGRKVALPADQTEYQAALQEQVAQEGAAQGQTGRHQASSST